MTDVTVVGLGGMGTALARTLVGAGHGVTVWNRTPERTDPLVRLGARGAASLAGAVAASPVVVVCVADQAVTRRAFEEGGALAALDARVLVQLSTGTPREAREAQAWFEAWGCVYLDGAIMPYPEGIGRADARILFAGPESAWHRARPVLDCLGGDLRHVGENIAAAAVLDMAFLTYELCSYLATLHGALVCEAEGVDVDVLATMYDAGSPPHRLATVIGSGEVGEPGASIAVWRAALGRVQEQAADSGIDPEVPDLVASLLDRALAAGHGDQDVAAVIEVLRR